MSATALRLRRRRDHTSTEDPEAAGGASPAEQDFEERGSAATWTGGGARAARLATVVLWAGLACGPATLGWQVTHPPAAAVAGVDPALEAGLATRRGAAGEVAQEWVAAWLSTPQSRAQDLAPWWSGQVQLPQSPSRVSSTSVLDAVAVAPGVWSITVAATVTAPRGTPQREFFQVPVAVAGTTGSVGASVMGLPSPVAGPGGASLPNGTYDQVLALDAPVSASVQAFLTAMLTGTGDLTRYVRPGAPIAAQTPPRYARVAVQSVTADQDAPGVSSGTPGDKTTARVLAQVLLSPVATTAATAGLSAQYALTLTARAGRWEVSSVDPTPVLATDPSSTSTSSAGASAPTHSTTP